MAAVSHLATSPGQQVFQRGSYLTGFILPWFQTIVYSSRTWSSFSETTCRSLFLSSHSKWAILIQKNRQRALHKVHDCESWSWGSGEIPGGKDIEAKT
jgi:hypothetical protein